VFVFAEIRGRVIDRITRGETGTPVWRRYNERKVIARLRSILLRLPWPCNSRRGKLVDHGRGIATGRVQKHRARKCICKKTRVKLKTNKEPNGQNEPLKSEFAMRPQGYMAV
jgi:hypothetical protein